jgi:hypothetical protein
LQETAHPVFSVDGTAYGWSDVAEFARLSDDWDLVEREAAAGKAAVANWRPPEEEVLEAAREFRHERGLLAADDLAGWLERRRLSADDWLAYLSRDLARDALEAEVADSEAASEDEVWAEAMCSGVLDDCAVRLARLLALAPGVPLSGLDAAFGEFADRVATEDEVAREIAAARLDWVRVRFAAGLFSTEAAAAEAALWVRHDGETLENVCATAGTCLSEEEVWLEEAAPPLRPFFAAARPSEVVGPVEVEDGFLVVEVRGKTPVAPDDPDVRARAAKAVAERIADRMATDHVVWHEQL